MISEWRDYWLRLKSGVRSKLKERFFIAFSFARVGSTVNFNSMEPLYDWVGQFYTGYTCTGIVLMLGKFYYYISPYLLNGNKFSLIILILHSSCVNMYYVTSLCDNFGMV